MPYIPGDSFALNYSRKRNFAEFDEDEVSHLAAKAALPERVVLETVRETASDFIAVWKRVKDALPMLGGVREAIETLLPTLPILKTP